MPKQWGRAATIAALSMLASNPLTAQPAAPTTACEALKTMSFVGTQDVSGSAHELVVTSAQRVSLSSVLEAKALASLRAERRTPDDSQSDRDAEDATVVDESFCRATVSARPSKQSNINIEVWLPDLSRWNRRFLGTGTGGSGGAIEHTPLAAALLGGYAAANTDLGSSGGSRASIDGLESLPPLVSFDFAVDQPELQIDWAYRATHLMTVAAKQIVGAYYGKPAQHSYFKGCSSGGLQALSEVQKFPSDYDGVIAEAPGNNRTNIHMGVLWQHQALHQSPAHSLSPKKIAAVHQAVLNACDALDGIADRVIDEPRRCQFDPARLQCAGRDTAECLTQPQVSALQKVYAGPTNPRTGQRYFPGLPRGAELELLPIIAASKPDADRTSFAGWLAGLLRWAPASGWNGRLMDFDFDAHADAVNAALGHLNATHSNLSEFRDRGAKLILWAGTADGVPHFNDLVDYYESVAQSMGGATETARFARLFIAPGVQHCGGGPGPNKFDMLGALDSWVSNGTAPEHILATKYQGDDVARGMARSRPLCAYPKVARWNGHGSVDRAENFICADPAR